MIVDGNISLYNGTFDPVLSKLDPDTGAITNTTFAGWSTINNGTYGGIATFNDKVFVTDMETSGDGDTQGIVVFESGSASRFATDIEPIDLNIGLDGLLYALSSGGSPSGRKLSVYDPTSLNKIRDIDLTASTSIGFTAQRRSIAANSAGEIFVSTLSGTVFQLEENGDVINSNDFSNDCSDFDLIGNCNFFDLDISTDGTLLLTSRFGAILSTDTTLTSLNLIVDENSSLDSRFATFASVQDTAAVPFEFTPTSGLLLSLGLLSVNYIRKRNKQLKQASDCTTV